MRSTKPRRIQFLLRQRLMASSDANLNDCSSAQRLEHIKDEKSLQAVSFSSVVDVTTELSSASTLCDIPHSLDKFASGMEFNGKSVELPLAGRFTTEVTRGAHATSTVALRCNDASQRRVPSSEEDSVADMNYMSESSNLSAAVIDLTPISNVDDCLHNAERGSEMHPHVAKRRRFKSAISVEVENTTKASDDLAEAKPKARTTRKARSSRKLGETLSPAATTEKVLKHRLEDERYSAATYSEPPEHLPLALPKFAEIQSCMWTASWPANCPTEDRSASLVNLLLQPLPPNYDSETQLAPLELDYRTLVRLNLWAVIDGHGGGSVATYGSEVLLPHIAASVSRALGCAIVDRGICTVNGQLRDANALDLDGLIQTSDRSHGNPNSIHYRSPFERNDSEEEEEVVGAGEDFAPAVPQTVCERNRIVSQIAGGVSLVQSLLEPRQGSETVMEAGASVSSVKTSVKTGASPANNKELLGNHSPREVAAISRAITESFLAVDEGWINSIDPVATQQTSCQSNGRWNSGACALVVFTIQRLDWTSVSEPEREEEVRGSEASRLNTSQNRDAARRRILDNARRAKIVSSMSAASSTSSLTTEDAVNGSGIESEITETEGEDDGRTYNVDIRKRDPAEAKERTANRENASLICPPGGCSCHCYKTHVAMIYTAHVGDCRAVMLGSAPRTIKVGGFSSHHDAMDDESSHHSSDETECLSSSDHDADSSEDEDVDFIDTGSTVGCASLPSTSTYVNFPRRVVRQRNAHSRAIDDASGPYIALPPLDVSELEFAANFERQDGRRGGKDPSESSSTSQDSTDGLPLIQLPPGTRPIDLTTDHSAYNPAEVTAVLRRCNNAPRAISSGVGGGIKRVAGSLAVTRALGDAYLKTPLLSFRPYKNHAPYITALPEVNYRPLLKDGDKVLVLATDGVWERAGGDDVLRWVRNFYDERIAEAERRNRRMDQVEKSQASNDDTDESFDPVPISTYFQQEGSERDLFEKMDPKVANSRKRELSLSPVGPTAKRRKRGRQNRLSYNVADVITRRVLNKVRRARNISTLQALMSLPQGRARRSKHDDITVSVVDLSAFVS